jgi:hypothetical protein
VYGIEENTPAYFAAQDVQNSAGVFGLGDMNPTFFFTPVKAHKLILGAGPAFMLPTATEQGAGTGKAQHWTLGCGPGAAGSLDDWCAD